MKDMSWSSYNPETTHFDGLYFRVNWSGKVDSVEVNSGLETSKVRLMYRVQGSPIQIKIQPFRKPVKKFNSTDHMPKRTKTFQWSPTTAFSRFNLKIVMVHLGKSLMKCPGVWRCLNKVKKIRSFVKVSNESIFMQFVKKM